MRPDKQSLLTNLFGGSGTNPRNLMWLKDFVNNSAYTTQFENRVADALRRGENVRFSIEPHFDGYAAAPYKVEVCATTSTGAVVVPDQSSSDAGRDDGGGS